MTRGFVTGAPLGSYSTYCFARFFLSLSLSFKYFLGASVRVNFRGYIWVQAVSIMRSVKR